MSAHLPGSFAVEKGVSRLLPSSFGVTARCVTPPSNLCSGIYISSLIRQWRKTCLYCKGSCFFDPVTLPSRYCQCWATQFGNLGFWTNPCKRLVGCLLVRAPEVSPQPLSIRMKIPLGLLFTRSISYLLKHIFKYLHANESLAVEYYIR